jgi:hypothetical protein
MPDLTAIVARHNRSQDTLVSAFETNLREIVLRAQGRTIAQLAKKLAMSDGAAIAGTPGNMLVLRNAGKMFMQEMDRAGYQRLLAVFTGEFHQTLPFLQDTLRYLGDQVGKKWGEELGFTAKDLSLLGAVQANSAAMLTSAIEAVAGQAVTRGLFSVSGLRFGSLVETLTTKIETSIGKATSIANTAVSVYFRTASDRAFAIVTKGLPEQVLRYRFSGPKDKLERPWCRAMSLADKSYTRAEIDKMNNGQFPVGSCFMTVGGMNCRHFFCLSTDDLEVSSVQSA